MPSTVDQIRQLLDKRDGLSEEAMRPLAAAYSDEVTRVNERLHDAAQLLRKGLRSEAVQRASLHPNALEGASRLDFPEIEDWFEILQFLGIPVPPELNRDAADQLNEAIVDTQPLAALLKQHRRLAIARAPLAWRLKVLRRLAKLDPTNDIWEEDLETWEEARLKQMPAELHTAVTARDVGCVAAIVDELTAQGWRIAPDAKLTKQAQAALNRFTHEAQTERLRTLAPQLHDAFSSFDEPEARRLRDEWRGIQKQMTAPLPAELAEEAEPALVWLEEVDREADRQREQAAAVNRLESALDAGASLADLQRAFHSTTRFDEPLRPELQQRYRIAVEEHQLATKRKTQAIFSGIAAATVIAIAAFGYWQVQSQKDQRIVTAHDQFKALLDDQKIAEAEEFWRRIESSQPDVAADARLSSLASRLTGLLSDEASRAKQFASYLEQADAPDPAEIDSAALSRAENLAANEDEKQAAFAVRRRRSQWEREIQAEHSQAITTALAEIREQLDQFESMPAVELDTANFDPLIDRMRNLTVEFPRRGTAAKGQIDLVRSRAVAMRDAVRDKRQQMETEQRSLQRLVEARSLTAFAQGLEAFVRDLPASPMADEFTQVAAESPLWDRALAWNELAAAISSSLNNGLTPDRAKSLLAKHAELRDDLARNPAESATPEWRRHLETVSNRTTVLENIFGDLPQAVIADLITVVEPTDGTRYFAYQSYHERFVERFETSANTRIEVVVNESGAVADQSVKGPLTTIPEPRATVLWLTAVGNTGRQTFLKDWDGKFLRTIAELRGRKQLDGKIKEMLLFHLLDGACEGSPALAEIVASERELLRSREEERKRWFAGSSINNALDREVEASVVKRLAAAYRDRPPAWQELRELADRRYHWVGFILRDASGSITSHLSDTPDDRGELLTVRASLANPEQVEWVSVGTYQSGQATLDATAGDLTAGRPLFYLSSSTATDS